MMRTHCMALLIGVLSLEGCSTLPEHSNQDRGGIPGQAYFSQIYDADAANAALQTRDEYLMWIRRFYDGSELYPWGYRDLESAVLDGLDPASTARLRAKLDAVGMQIGAEWAKDRRARVIHTAMLSVWGEALQSGAAAGRAESVADTISADVQSLLAGELPATAIGAARYGAGFNVALGPE